MSRLTDRRHPVNSFFPQSLITANMEYWTIIDDRHAGPYSADELIGMGIKPDSPVWTSGLPDWVEACEIEELKAAMEARDRAMRPATEVAVDEEPAAVAEEPQIPAVEQPGNPVEEADTNQPMPGQGYGYHQQGYYPQGPAQQAPADPRFAPQPQPQPVWDWQREAMVPDEPCPPAYLVWSIIVTILCCQVLGIAAIICSAQTKQAYGRGNLAKAKKMSEWAQWLIII